MDMISHAINDMRNTIHRVRVLELPPERNTIHRVLEFGTTEHEQKLLMRWMWLQTGWLCYQY